MAKKIKKPAGKTTSKSTPVKGVATGKKVAAKAAPKKAAPALKTAAAPKKTVPAVPKKAAAPKKTVPAAQKAAPPAPKKTAPVAPKKAEKVAKPAKDTAAVSKAAAPAPKPATVSLPKKGEAAPKVSPQLNIFPQLSQRPIAHKPVKATVEDSRTRYSDEELKEFEVLILAKMEKAREEFKLLKDTLNRNNDEGTDATSGGNTKVLEDGAETAEKENLSQLAARQQKYIANLENALVRIKNGTYGICSVTGKLISRERLIAVPHTTQSIEAKMMKKD